jgi:hypothetical protein
MEEQRFGNCRVLIDNPSLKPRVGEAIARACRRHIEAA